MKKLIFASAGLLLSLVFVACGGNNNSSDGGNVGIQCPPGTAFVNGYCTGVNGIVGTGSLGFYSDNTVTRSMKITGGMAAFLRDAMGVCDRERISGGGASCQTWMNGAFDVVIQSPNAQTNALMATFRAARPTTSPYGDYSYSLPSGGALAGALLGMPVPNSPAAYLPKLQITMQLFPINNSQGFEARGYGDLYSKANRSLIQLQVPQGKLQDASLPYQILLNGQPVMSGQFIRCNTADCGLSRPVGY